MKNHLVVALAYDQLCTFEFGCVVELFDLKRPELDVDWYRFQTCAINAGELQAAGGITVKVAHGLELLDRADTIIIPGWSDKEKCPPQQLLDKLLAAHARGARICSICSGVFVLAAAGLLNGKTATTHWRYVETLAACYPRIQVKTNVLYVDEGNILSSAGSAAGLDMLLHVVRRDHGSKIANLVAQRLVIAPLREGDQIQYVAQPVSETSRLNRAIESVRRQPALAHTLSSLAEHAAMSERNLQIQFKLATGLSFSNWLLHERLSLARALLESSPLSMSQVATQAGFASEQTLRRYFKQIHAISPLAYRKEFQQKLQQIKMF